MEKTFSGQILCSCAFGANIRSYTKQRARHGTPFLQHPPSLLRRASMSPPPPPRRAIFRLPSGSTAGTHCNMHGVGFGRGGCIHRPRRCIDDPHARTLPSHVPRTYSLKQYTRDGWCGSYTTPRNVGSMAVRIALKLGGSRGHRKRWTRKISGGNYRRKSGRKLHTYQETCSTILKQWCQMGHWSNEHFESNVVHNCFMPPFWAGGCPFADTMRTSLTLH